jgi:hypothetical protein
VEKIATIGKDGSSSNHLEIGIMNDGKLSLSVSIWTSGGRYNQSVWFGKEQVLELLNAIEEWVDYTETRAVADPIFKALAKDYFALLKKVGDDILAEEKQCSKTF